MKPTGSPGRARGLRRSCRAWLLLRGQRLHDPEGVPRPPVVRIGGQGLAHGAGGSGEKPLLLIDAAYTNYKTLCQRLDRDTCSIRICPRGTPSRTATSRRLVALSPGPGSPPVMMSSDTCPSCHSRTAVRVRS